MHMYGGKPSCYYCDGMGVFLWWQGRVLLRLLPDSRTNVQREYNLAQLEVSDID